MSLVGRFYDDIKSWLMNPHIKIWILIKLSYYISYSATECTLYLAKVPKLITCCVILLTTAKYLNEWDFPHETIQDELNDEYANGTKNKSGGYKIRRHQSRKMLKSSIFSFKYNKPIFF